MTEGDESLTKSAPRVARNPASSSRVPAGTVDPRLDDPAPNRSAPSATAGSGRSRSGQSTAPPIVDPLASVDSIEQPPIPAGAPLLSVPVLPRIVAEPTTWSGLPIPTTLETGSTTKVGPGRGRGARSVPSPPLVISPIDEPATVPVGRVATEREYLHELEAIRVITSEQGGSSGDELIDPDGGVTLADTRPARRPILFRRRPRRRVRRVTRVVRHVDTWSVFKVALVFNAVLYVIGLTAGVLLWNVAYTTGTVNNVEKFFEQFGWSSFHFKGGEIFHAGWIAGLFGAIGLTGFAVLLATLFNLITDLVGGIRVSVLEEEVTARPARAPAETETELGLELALPPDTVVQVRPAEDETQWRVS